MKPDALEGIKWYVDETAEERAEPGIHHSFMASLATAVNYIEADVDPAWLMGASGFAFRIFMNKGLCPSAMSVFDFSAILPEAVEQAGYQCGYVSRMWADVMDAGAMLAKAGKLSRCGDEAMMFADYYVGCYYGARCYARDYIKVIADGDENLNKAAACYEKVAEYLWIVWESFQKKHWPTAETFKELARSIRDAKQGEEQAISLLKTYLGLDTCTKRPGGKNPLRRCFKRLN